MTNKKKLILVLILVAAFGSFGCPAKNVDTVSNAVVAASEGYLKVQEMLITAHEQHLINDAQWKQISAIRWKAKPIHTAMLDAWVLYGTSQKPTDLQTAIDLAAQLTKLIVELQDIAAQFGGGF